MPGKVCPTTRADYRQKDVVIESGSVTRNITRLVEKRFDNGYIRKVPSDEFSPDKYNFVADLTQMGVGGRKRFWRSVSVELIVNIGQLDTGGKTPTTIFDMMAKLGPEFLECTKRVFVTLVFPERELKLPTTAEYIPIKGRNRRYGPAAPIGAIDLNSTPSLAHVKALVACIEGFKSLERLSITLQTPAKQQKPIDVPQLNHCLPFYQLSFTKWRISWKVAYMTRTEAVNGWPIWHLDDEWAKIRAQHVKELKTAECVTFTHPSLSAPLQ